MISKFHAELPSPSYIQCVVQESSLKLNEVEGANSSATDSNAAHDDVK